MHNEIFATINISGQTVTVFACFDTLEELDNDTPTYYDIERDDGVCLNLGEPFYEIPTLSQIKELLDQ